MEKKLSDDIIAKNILLERTCDTCKHIEYECNNLEICHGGNFAIPDERTCIFWEKYQTMNDILDDFMKHKGW